MAKIKFFSFSLQKNETEQKEIQEAFIRIGRFQHSLIVILIKCIHHAIYQIVRVQKPFHWGN